MFLPSSPQNSGQVDDQGLIDLSYQAAYEVDVDRQNQLLMQINARASDLAWAVETYSPFQVIFTQPWMFNLCQSPTGWVTATGQWQYAHTFATDKAPEGRRGRLKT
jgi:hypothetical protein